MAAINAWKNRSDEENHTSRVKSLLTSFIYPKENDFNKYGSPSHSTQLINTSKLDEQHEQGEVKSSDGLLELTSFITRLETYTCWPWLGKPQQLSPVCCAWLGWKQVQQDMLECVTCGAYMSVHLPSVAQVSVYEACLERVERKLLSAHKEHCAWTLVHTPVSLLSAEWTSGDQAVAAFLSRLSGCKKLQDKLPVISKEATDAMGMCDNTLLVIASLDTSPVAVSGNDRGDEASPKWLEAAIICALLGWTANETSSTLKCRYCKREIGIWNFLPKTDLNSQLQLSHGVLAEGKEAFLDIENPSVHSVDSSDVLLAVTRNERDETNTHNSGNRENCNSHLLSPTTEESLAESAQKMKGNSKPRREVEENATGEQDDANTQNSNNRERTNSDLPSQTIDECLAGNTQNMQSNPQTNKELEENAIDIDKEEDAVYNRTEEENCNSEIDYEKAKETKVDVTEEADAAKEIEGDLTKEPIQPKVEHCIPEIIITQPEDEEEKPERCIPDIVISHPDTDEDCSEETSSTSHTDRSEEEILEKDSCEEVASECTSQKRKLSQEDFDRAEHCGLESSRDSSEQITLKTRTLLKTQIKRRRADGLNPLTEHQVWCPWIASTSFTVPGGGTETVPPGWPQLLQLLLKYVHIRDNPDRQIIHGAKQVPLLENVHKVRQIMKNWKSPALSPQKTDSSK